MRLFVGFSVPSSVPLELQKKFENYDLTLAKSFHLTLKFLGDVSPSRVPDIIRCLHSIRQQPFTLTFGNLGVFSDHGKPRVLWIRLEPEQPLQELHAAIDEALAPSFARDPAYHSHATLGRFRSDKHAFSLPSVLTLTPPPYNFFVSSFSLYDSVLAQGKYVHNVLATFPLHS